MHLKKNLSQNWPNYFFLRVIKYLYHLNPLSIKSLIQKSKRYIFMGRFLPVKFFPSSLLNLLSPSPHFPLWKDKSLLLPPVLSSRSFSTLLSLSSALCVYLTLPGFAGASPLALSSPAPPDPSSAKACRQRLLGLGVGPGSAACSVVCTGILIFQCVRAGSVKINISVARAQRRAV